jgi:hypothetical protein
MIIYHCSDLIFATKIRSTCQTLDVESHPARDEARLRQYIQPAGPDQDHKPVAAFFVDLEASDHSLELISLCKQIAANVQVIAFASHVADALLQSAKQHGADKVCSRGSFTTNLPALLEPYRDGQ